MYNFSETRETTQSQQILKGFKGCLVVDGYAGYNVFRTEDIKIQRCWAHVRRKFFDIYSSAEKVSESSLSEKAVEQMELIFHKESKFRAKQLTADEIKEERNKPYYQTYINNPKNIIDASNPAKTTTLATTVGYLNK